MKKTPTHLASRIIVMAVLSASSLFANPPDLTKSNSVDRTRTYNLGPTGLRGWIYTRAASNLDASQGRTTKASRQILVTHVGTNSPASGVLEVNDVILGVNGKPFDDDARKAIGRAITEAEKSENRGVLKLLRFRDGKTENVELKLRVMGSYSVTAPYNCPKSKLILAEACKALEREPLENNLWGAISGLALLATGNPDYLPKVQAFARAIGPATLKLERGPGMVAWDWGYKLVFLSEYYLLTGDKDVLHAVQEYTVALAKGQGVYGTFGHGISDLTRDGKLHGSIPPYGPVNQAGLIASLGIVMGHKCGVDDPEVLPAIDRSAKFYGYFVDKGAIPYGEHMPWPYHENNGKNALAAVLFDVSGDQRDAARFFARMSTAAYPNREYGHTGQGFSYLWSAMGANVGGPEALAAFMKEAQWHLDLVRRCDGTFTYDGAEQYGPGRTDDNSYYGKSSYNGLSPNATYVLAYAIPLKKLHINGKASKKADWLSRKEVSQAIASGRFDLERSKMTYHQLVAALDDWSPIVRGWAAEELAKRPEAKHEIPALIKMAEGDHANRRQGACEALGCMKSTEALPVFVRLLKHQDRWLRVKAAEALKKMGAAAKPVLPDMLQAVADTAEPIEPIVWDDPVQLTHGQLADALFGGLMRNSIEGVDRKLLYPAFRAVSRNADCMARSKLEGALNALTEEDVKALAPDILELAVSHGPADTMFSRSVRVSAFKVLAKYHFQEGIRAAPLVAKGKYGCHNAVEIMKALETYGSAAQVIIPDLKQLIIDYKELLKEWMFPDSTFLAVENAIKVIEAAKDHPPLRSVTSASAIIPPVATPQLKPPLHGLEEVGWQDVELRGGFWGPRLDVHHKVTIPHVIAKLDDRKHIANFDIAARVLKGAAAKQGGTDSDPAGQALAGDAGNHGPGSNDSKGAKEGEIVGHSAFDSDLHKALEGACYTLGHCDDPALLQRVEGILARILAAQAEDGYMVSYFIAKEPQNKWANLRLNHEMYNAGHFFEFAVAHHQLTGKTNALEAAKRFADHIDRTFGHGKRYDVDGHQEIELALVKLYRATGEKRYLDLCRFLLEERGHVHGTERKLFTEVLPRGNPDRKPGETNPEWMKRKWSLRDGKMQDHKPVLEQTEAVGHAVRAGYMYAAMTDLARFSEAPEYAKAVRTLWDDVLRYKFYLTGGVGTAQYDEEGFGDPYMLPNSTYCESCANMANVLWQHRLNLLDGDAKYADVMELTLYNSAISGLALSGKGFFYQNPLEARDGAERRDWIGLACCPTSISRFTPQVGGLVYARKAGKIFVNLYASGVATIDIGGGREVKICQETDYPWDGRIRLTIGLDKPTEFDLCVRIPGWALGKPVPGDLYRFVSTKATPVSLKINGETVEAKPGKDGYVVLARSWKAGDEVALDLPMPVRRVHAHEKVEADKGKVALMRGPIVYCLEGVDNKGVDLFKLSLPRSAELSAEHRAALLGGVTVIHPRGLDANKTPVTLTAIPYFAWANREKGPMTVWINESVDEKTK